MKQNRTRVDLLYLSQEDVIAAGGLDTAEAVKALDRGIGRRLPLWESPHWR